MTPYEDDTASLAEARDWLRSQIDDGAICPCCKQLVKNYKRQVTSASAATLILMWRSEGTATLHLPGLRQRHPVVGRAAGDPCKMVYWGLIEEESVRREDGGRAGWWGVTEKGVDWIEGRITIPRYARVYNGRCLGLEGELRTIQQALGTKFNYRELMGS